VDAAVDNRPDNTGLDDGPPLSKRNIMAWKIPLILKAWQAGVSGRVIAEIFDVSHETVYSKMAGVARNKAQSPVEQPPQTVAGDSFFDGKDYSAALGKIEYLLNQERQHLSFMTEENQPDYFLDPIKQDIASYEAAIELIKQAALTRHKGA
jgi:hypothetical protein